MLKDTLYNESTIGEIVAADFRAAEIFKNAGIDFCCGGEKSLGNTCNEKAIDSILLVKQLRELDNKAISRAQNFNEWELDFLSDYIVNTHHKYVVKTLPELVLYTQKIATVHGEHHTELLEVADLFGKLNTELLQHLQNEEGVLFPAIKEVLKSNSPQAKAAITSEISRMSGEHEFAGGAMDQINQITTSYAVPEDGCNTYKVTFKLLHQFENDLHIHVHLENNILYPKALAL